MSSLSLKTYKLPYELLIKYSFVKKERLKNILFNKFLFIDKNKAKKILGNQGYEEEWEGNYQESDDYY